MHILRRAQLYIPDHHQAVCGQQGGGRVPLRLGDVGWFRIPDGIWPSPYILRMAEAGLVTLEELDGILHLSHEVAPNSAGEFNGGPKAKGTYRITR